MRKLLIVLCLLAVLAAGCVKVDEEKDYAPDFVLVNAVDGQPVILSELQGKPVVLTFWAVWCSHCVNEMPEFQAFQEEYGDKYHVVAIISDEEPAVGEMLVLDNGFTLKLLMDHTGKVRAKYGIKAYPTTFIIDAKGVVVCEHTGAITAAQLAAHLEELGL